MLFGFGDVSSNTKVGLSWLGLATSNAEALPKDYESSGSSGFCSKGFSQSLFKVAIDSNILLLKLLMSSN